VCADCAWICMGGVFDVGVAGSSSWGLRASDWTLARVAQPYLGRPTGGVGPRPNEKELETGPKKPRRALLAMHNHLTSTQTASMCFRIRGSSKMSFPRAQCTSESERMNKRVTHICVLVLCCCMLSMLLLYGFASPLCDLYASISEIKAHTLSDIHDAVICVQMLQMYHLEDLQSPNTYKP
jgi:hypothetical protein